MEFDKFEHRDSERRSFAIVCTKRILDKMFGWRAITDSSEQSSIAFHCDICLILTHASEHFGDNWCGIVDRSRIHENDPFRADTPRKTQYFRVHPKSDTSPKWLSSRTDLKHSPTILKKYVKILFAGDLSIPGDFSCLLPIFRFRRFHPILAAFQEKQRFKHYFLNCSQKRCKLLDSR